MDPEEASKILTIAEKIKQSNIANKDTYFAGIYENFRTKYPTLYSMCCDPTCDIKVLRYMLNVMSDVHKGSKTSEQADVEIGQSLFDKYVATVVDVEKLKRKD